MAWEERPDSGKTGSERFPNHATATGERTWQAKAWDVHASVAMAENDLTRAKDCVSTALRTTEGFEVPLPAGECMRRPPKFLITPGTSNQASATAKSAEWQSQTREFSGAGKIHFRKHSSQHSPFLKSSLKPTAGIMKSDVR
jgi:hypothetical protein